MVSLGSHAVNTLLTNLQVTALVFANCGLAITLLQPICPLRYFWICGSFSAETLGILKVPLKPLRYTKCTDKTDFLAGFMLVTLLGPSMSPRLPCSHSGLCRRYYSH